MTWALLTALIEAASNFFKWRAVEAEINSKLVLQHELERIDDENDKLEAQITALRSHNDSSDNLYADKLRKRVVQRASFIETLPTAILVPDKSKNN